MKNAKDWHGTEAEMKRHYLGLVGKEEASILINAHNLFVFVDVLRNRLFLIQNVSKTTLSSRGT